jgi:hypothetical protein
MRIAWFSMSALLLVCADAQGTSATIVDIPACMNSVCMAVARDNPEKSIQWLSRKGEDVTQNTLDYDLYSAALSECASTSIKYREEFELLKSASANKTISNEIQKTQNYRECFSGYFEQALVNKAKL